MWTIRSHLLQHLAEIMSEKVTFKWTNAEKKSFYDIIHIVDRNALLAYQVFNKRFDIHMDAIDY